MVFLEMKSHLVLFFSIDIKALTMKKFILILFILVFGLQSQAQNIAIDSGSYIIDMGVTPQTIDNGLKPYGLVFALVDFKIPVIWSISSTKLKDGVDFIHNGKSYSGGPFIVQGNLRTPSVDSLIATWTAKGVVADIATSSFMAPFSLEITTTLSWTLDKDNGDIAEDYFKNAEIPSSSYNFKDPDSLGGCDQVFVMPHADPTWATHKRLLSWNASIDSGGFAGTIWAACHAVSELEDIVNPLDSSKRMNFLMKDLTGSASDVAMNYKSGLGPTGAPDHGDPSFPPAADYAHPNDNIMQFLGDLTPSLLDGSEQVFLPNTGWRPSTKIAIWDDNHPEVVTSNDEHRAALFAYGHAFGDTSRGQVFYQGGHDHDKTGGSRTEATRVASQRTLFNFSFLSAAKKQVDITHNLPNDVVLLSGSSTQLIAEVTNGNGGILSYAWSSDCSIVFSDPTNDTTLITAPVVTMPDTCFVLLEINEGCATSRSTFLKVRVFIVPPSQPNLLALVDKNTIYKDSSIEGNVLTNDQGFGESIRVTQVDANALAPTATITTSKGGKLTMDTFGNYTYSPALGFIGTDKVSYQVCNASPFSMCKEEVLVIQVFNLPDPTIVNFNSLVSIPDKGVSYGDTIEVNLMANDFDPEGNTLSFKGVENPNNLGTFKVNGTLSSIPGLDTAGVSIADVGKLKVNPDGKVVFIPKDPFVGNVIMNYKVCDDHSSMKCKEEQFNIDVQGPPNSPADLEDNFPVGMEDFVSTEMKSKVTGNFMLNDYDPDESDLITMNGLIVNLSGPSTPVDTVSTKRGGSVTFYQDGTYLYSPKDGFSGTDYVVYEICDTSTPVKCARATIHMLVAPVVKDFQDFPASKYGEVYTRFLDGASNTQGGAAPVWLGARLSDDCVASTSLDASSDSFDDGLIIPDVIDYKVNNTGVGHNVFKIVVNSSVSNAKVFYKMWIDWDDNDMFDSTVTGFGITNSPDTVSNTLNIPLTFSGGFVNFRLVVQSDSTMLDSSILNGGEVEDYRFLFAEPLPVTLLGLEAELNNAKVTLSWSTAMELNNAYFEVQRMVSGSQQFELVGSVSGAGNSNSLLKYNYVDDITDVASGHIFYRLRQVDMNGESELSDVVSVSQTKANVLAGLKVYPNPVSQYLNVDFANVNEVYSYSFINAMGKIVFAGQASLNKRIDISQLPKGIYAMRISLESGFAQNYVIMKE